MSLCTIILHLSPVLALVFSFFRRIILYYYLVIFIGVYLALLSHSRKLRPAPPRLFTKMLIHLCLQYAEFVHLSLSRHAKPSVASCTVMQSGPEIRELFYHSRIIPYGGSKVTRTIQKGCPIEKSHHVVRLKREHIVEILYCSIIISYLLAQQSSVIVSEEVCGFKVEGYVIILHGSTQIIESQTCHGAIDIVVCPLGFQMNSLGKAGVSPLPLAS